MMSIKQFEAATGLKRSTVRFYEEAGLLTPDVRANGYRVYGNAHFDTVRAVQLGQSLGFSIAEIKSLMSAWSSGRLDFKDRRQAIAVKLSECVEKSQKIEALIKYLNATLVWMDAGEIGDKPPFGATPNL